MPRDVVHRGDAEHWELRMDTTFTWIQQMGLSSEVMERIGLLFYRGQYLLEVKGISFSGKKTAYCSQWTHGCFTSCSFNPPGLARLPWLPPFSSVLSLSLSSYLSGT